VINRFFPWESPQKGQEEEPMKDWQSLSHVRWECKYHIVFVSKYRHKRIYGKIREKIGDGIRGYMEK